MKTTNRNNAPINDNKHAFKWRNLIAKTCIGNTFWQDITLKYMYMCAQRRCRSVYAFVQSDKNLHWCICILDSQGCTFSSENVHPWLSKMHTLKMCTLGYPKCTQWKCAPLAIQNAHSENVHPWLSKMHTVKMCTLGYPKFKCTQWRFLSDCANVDNEDWSDCADEQANLRLRWVHMSEGTFSHGMA